MSLYKDSSLAMIPTAYKDGKLYSVRPTDGSGDFTFSRGSNLAATRVASSGYIEKGRENLLTYSNELDGAAWSATRLTSTPVQGAQGYDGTNDAWTITPNATFGTHYINVGSWSAASGVFTISVYAKANGYDYLSIRDAASADTYALFELDSASTSTNGGAAIASTITSVGNDWYRCTFTLNRTAGGSNNLIFYVNDVNTTYVANYSGDTTSGILLQDAQVEQGLVATDYIETTTTSVSAGILEDMPRLDYSGGASCPSLLLEPQRSNTITGSEYFDGGSLINTAITAEYNTADTLSPEGLYNAAKLTAASNFPRYYDFPTIGDNVNVTLSAFAKAGSASVFTIRAFNKNNETAVVNFDLSAGTAELSQYDELIPTFDIENMGNDWYRCSMTTNTGSGATAFQIRPISHAQGETGGWSGTNYIYAYGAQMEQDASYPTSYIPTYGSSVTRSADSCAATSVGDVIGQTQGTFYWEGSLEENPSGTNMQFALSDGTTSQQIKFVISSSSTYVAAEVKNGGVQQFYNNHNIDAKTNRKYAIAYDTNDFAFYIDGTQIATDTSGSVPVCSKISFDSGVSSNGIHGNFKSVVLFPTRLTNAELAALTTL